MRLVLGSWLAALLLVAGCTRNTADRDTGTSGGSDMGSVVDVGLDAPAAACTTAAQCNDGFTCTIDDCVVGNVCMHTPVDGMCTGAGEHCDVHLGCTTMSTCNTATDCDDGDFCNGTESCSGAHQCYHLADRNCDDGNPCTMDSCDTAANSCSYTALCDSGIVTMDAGPACTTFTAPGDFDGVYALLPAQSQACGGANYNVSQVTLTVSGSTLTAVTGTSGAINMTGTMTGSDFDVSGTVGTNVYRLTGSFACRERFMGHWSAMVHGIGCMSQEVDVRGSRR